MGDSRLDLMNHSRFRIAVVWTYHALEREKVDDGRKSDLICRLTNQGGFAALRSCNTPGGKRGMPQARISAPPGRAPGEGSEGAAHQLIIVVAVMIVIGDHAVGNHGGRSIGIRSAISGRRRIGHNWRWITPSAIPAMFTPIVSAIMPAIIPVVRLCGVCQGDDQSGGDNGPLQAVLKVRERAVACGLDERDGGA